MHNSIILRRRQIWTIYHKKNGLEGVKYEGMQAPEELAKRIVKV